MYYLFTSHTSVFITSQTLRKTLDARGFTKTKIVASDGGWGIVNDMNKDSELANIVDYVG